MILPMINPTTSILQKGRSIARRLCLLMMLGATASFLCASENLIRMESIQSEQLDDCVVERFECESPTMGRAIKAWIVLPPAYQAEREGTALPVLYALHGYGAPWDTYAKMTRLRQSLKDQPMIVVGFDGDTGSWYVDSPSQPNSQFTTFFFEELIPSVEAQWNTDGRRAITGFSMGGFGAMHLALTRPEAFVSVSGFSTAIDPLGGLPERILKGFLPLLGEDYASEESPLRLNHRLSRLIKEGGHFPPLYQHCGTEDRLLAAQRRFCDLLAELNQEIREKQIETGHEISYRFVETPGAHDWAFWHGNIAELLHFHFEQFNRD
jgi:S-formylglutathione hydrolase FrmB